MPRSLFFADRLFYFSSIFLTPLSMDALLAMSPLVATPLVVEYILSLFPPTVVQKLADNYKRMLSLLVGVILTLLAEYVKAPLVLMPREMFLLLLAGLINGAMASGAVALANRLATRSRAIIDIENVSGGMKASQVTLEK